MCVSGKPALAVVLSDVTHLTYPISPIRKTITSGNYGHTAISKDFLQPGQESAIVKRGDDVGVLLFSWTRLTRMIVTSFDSVSIEYRMV